MLYVGMYESHTVTASENKEPLSHSVVPVTGRHSQPVQGTNLRRGDINKHALFRKRTTSKMTL